MKYRLHTPRDVCAMQVSEAVLFPVLLDFAGSKTKEEEKRDVRAMENSRCASSLRRCYERRAAFEKAARRRRRHAQPATKRTRRDEGSSRERSRSDTPRYIPEERRVPLSPRTTRKRERERYSRTRVSARAISVAHARRGQKDFLPLAPSKSLSLSSRSLLVREIKDTADLIRKIASVRCRVWMRVSIFRIYQNSNFVL